MQLSLHPFLFIMLQVLHYRRAYKNRYVAALCQGAEAPEIFAERPQGDLVRAFFGFLFFFFFFLGGGGDSNLSELSPGTLGCRSSAQHNPAGRQSQALAAHSTYSVIPLPATRCKEQAETRISELQTPCMNHKRHIERCVEPSKNPKASLSGGAVPAGKRSVRDQRTFSPNCGFQPRLA